MGAEIVLILAAGVFFLALIIPILFDVEYPVDLPEKLPIVEKALCFIFEGTGTASCTDADDTFTFIGLNDISINGTGPKEITFALGVNGTIRNCTNLGAGEIVCNGINGTDLEFKSLEGGTGIDITFDANTVTIDATSGLIGTGDITNGSNLFGEAVFKDKTDDILNFRGISGENAIITERVNDILINATITNVLGDLTDVFNDACLNNGEIIVKNTTSGLWECVTQSDFIASSGGANSLEFLRGHMSRGTATDATLAFVDYTYRMFEYEGTGMGATLDAELTWSFALSPLYNGTDLDVKVYWITDNFNGAGDVCWEGQFAPVSPPDDISDFSALGGTIKTACTAVTGTDILEITTLTFTEAEHGIDGDEMTLFKLTRNSDSNPSDTYGENVQGFGALIIWVILSAIFITVTKRWVSGW